MKTNSHLLSVILLSTCEICLPAQAASHYAERELLVKWKDGPDSYAAAVGNAQIGSTVKRNFNAIGWQHVQLREGMSVSDGIEAYRALGTVSAVEPNGSVQPILPSLKRANPKAPLEEGDVPGGEGAARTSSHSPGLHSPASGVVPNDPRFREQWNLKKIGATNAWATTTGSTNIVVAVLDTGVNYKHPDLAANMWRNPGESGLDANGKDKATNGIDDDGNGYVDDVHGVNSATGSGDPMDLTVNNFPHGTACAGILGAVGNNGEGLTGINWQLGILAVSQLYPKPFDYSSAGLEQWIGSCIAAFDYVIAMKRRGINIVATSNSYYFAQYSQAFKDALDAAGREGILNVFAAGNNSVNNDLITIYPSGFNLPRVIMVASSDSVDALASDSTYGRSSVHLAAPGVDILLGGLGTNYVYFTGTSAACPHVAGAVALLAAAAPGASPEEIKAAILGSVDPAPAFRSRLVTQGRLNVGRAMQQLTNTRAAPIVVSATPANSRTHREDRIAVRFSKSMDRASVENGFSLLPSVMGRFEWSEADRVMEFVPATPLISTNYTGLIAGTVLDTTGTTLDGNYNRATELSPGDDFKWTFSFPVPNDDLIDAQVIGDAIGSAKGTTRNASPELAEPDHAGDLRFNGSVWYRWRPSTEGWVTFETTQAAYDTLLAAYTGANLRDLVEVASNDNYGSRQTSRISFLAAAGASYSIAVSGKSGIDQNLMGPFNLSWYPTPPPSFSNSQFSTRSGAPGAKITLMGTNFTGATTVLFNGASASFTNALTNNLDLRITAVVPSDAISGPITIVTPHGSVTSTASFQVLPPPLSIRLISTNEFEIVWPAVGTTFVLETSETLDLDSWSPVQQSPSAVNGQSSLKQTSGTARRFYRLLLRR